MWLLLVGRRRAGTESLTTSRHMTKDEAILLAVANARGLVTLTAIETAEVNETLAYAADEQRLALAAARVAALQKRISSADPAAPYGLTSEVGHLKAVLDHQREVSDALRSDRKLPARATAHHVCAENSGPNNSLIGIFLASSDPSAS